MNATANTNQRLTTILLGGGMMGWGGMMTNDMANACIDMMRNIQSSP